MPLRPRGRIDVPSVMRFPEGPTQHDAIYDRRRGLLPGPEVCAVGTSKSPLRVDRVGCN